MPPIKDVKDTSHFDRYDENEKVIQYKDDGSGWDDAF